MYNYGTNSAPYFETVEGYTKTTLWRLYHTAPPIAWLSFQVIDESADTVLDSLEFSKNNEEERKSGEIRLRALIGKICRVSGGYPEIACEFRYGFGCDYIIRVHIKR